MIQQATYPLLGLHCAGCAKRAEDTLLALDGVEAVSVNLIAATVQIRYNNDLCTPKQFEQVIQQAGYQLLIHHQEDDFEELERIRLQAYRKQRSHMQLALCLGGIVMLLSMLWMHHLVAQIAAGFLTSVILILPGRSFFTQSWKQIRSKSLGMDTLVAMSTGIAYLYSAAQLLLFVVHNEGVLPHLYFEATSMIIAFVLLGKWLEARAKGNATKAIKSLIGMQPKEVCRINLNGEEEVCSIKDLMPGDTLLLRPGERIAADGEVIQGTSSVNESWLTGEAIPVVKEVGAPLYAGTINGKGALTMRASQVRGNTLLGRIIRRVQDAQGSKAPIQKQVDKVASVFVPFIIIAAIITFVLWWFFGGNDLLPQALVAAVAVLVIACPCALGLATPAAITVGIGNAAELGILVKDAKTLEVAHRINTVVLDKTGTITQGKPIVVSSKWFRNPADGWATLLKKIELASEHPLSGAIIENVSGYSDVTPTQPLQKIEAIPGKGLVAYTQGGLHLTVGNRVLLDEQRITISPEAQTLLQQFSDRGETVVGYADADGIIALLGIKDPIKEDSARAIALLKAKGIQAIMLSGDNETISRNVAQEVGINRVYAGVLPEEKANIVQKLCRQGLRVAMVGDGINDSAALAESDLSVAMGQGSDIAIETAMATIASNNLLQLNNLINLSRNTVHTIRQNLFWAFAYNLIAIPIAGGILYPLWHYQMHPMIASAAMAFSSISVVLNSLFLNRRNRPLRHQR